MPNVVIVNKKSLRGYMVKYFLQIGVLYCLSSVVLGQTSYEIINLGTLGGTTSFARSINDSTDVVGGSAAANETHAFLWRDSVMTDLGTLGSSSDVSVAHSINNAGYIAGQSTVNNPGVIHGFVWHNAQMIDIGTLGGLWSVAYGINNSNQVVGHSLDLNNEYRAILWQNGGLLDLGTLGGNSSRANAINNLGQIVGGARNQAQEYRAFLWENGSMSDLGIFGVAYGINERSQVVGSVDGLNGHAFLWDNGMITDLGTLGGTRSIASSINDSTEIVGMSINGTETRAFIWKNGEMKDLNNLISPNNNWFLTNASDINNNGQIVGEGIYNGQRRAFLLIPKRFPVFIVPGIAGTYADDTANDLAWIMNRGVPPALLQIDPLGKVYHDIIKTFENVGYKKDEDLFVVNYDWRLTPGPNDYNLNGHIEGLTGTAITDAQFTYGVDYLGWYIKKACEKWREKYHKELDSIDVIAHSTGGLVTRTYIQSDAYGDIYLPNKRLPTVRNFIMMGVPNRGASKAWNALHDNWIADPIYRFVLSKILNSAYQKILRGGTVNGPDYDITFSSIQDSLGNPSKIMFINQYVPTLRGLLATYDFINLGNGYTNVNNDTDQRNSFVVDLNNGYDLYPNTDPNGFLDAARVSVVYGTGQLTFDLVEQRDDFEINAIQSFTDWTRTTVLGGTIWYKDLVSGGNNGDGTVPITSSAGQFINDSRANRYPFNVGDHTSMVSDVEVQSTVLDILNVDYEQNNVSTGASPGIRDVLNVIVDPVESILTDGGGNRLGYSNSTGPLTEIPNSIWFGNTDGRGWVFGSVQEPINLQLTGLGEDYYVMVTVEDSGKYGGVVLEGFLGLGEVINYQITLNPLAVEQLKLTPDDYTLAQNYPNPFNPVTTIQYSIPQRSNVILKVYDVLGKEITTLVNEEKDRGVYSINFDASALASGIYLYRLQSGSFVETKKMIVIK